MNDYQTAIDTAILAFAREHGRYWKMRLCDLWAYSARTDDGANGYPLRNVRNSIGPAILDEYNGKGERAKPWPEVRA